jgi:Ca-activated chloride channel family protein
MRFAALPYVYLLWLLPALCALYVYAFRRKRHALAIFLEQTLAPRLLTGVSQTRPWLKALLLIAAVGCFVLALTQPQWGKRWQDVPRRGRDLMLLLDVSRSMLAEDVTPNRLERAKLDIKDLVTVLQREGGHRLGLIAFAGRASLQCPLTHDYAFFLQQLNALGPETVGRGGTLIGDAIRQALRAFTTLEHNFKDIILITDGDDHESFPLEAAKAATAQQVTIYTIGLGNPAVGAPIPLRTPQDAHTYVRYQGKEVRSRLRENLLIDLAHLTGGAYVPAGTHTIELDRIYTEHIARKARRDLDVTARERFVHRFQWFLAAGILLLGIEMLVPAGTNTED